MPRAFCRSCPSLLRGLQFVRQHPAGHGTSAQPGANTAITAVSELVLANFSAVVRLMKPKPYESSSIPTITPPAPVHREGFRTSQLMLNGCSSGLREEVQRTHIYRAESEQNCSVPEESIRKTRAVSASRFRSAVLAEPMVRVPFHTDRLSC
jgi:hypothetical protein